MRTGCRIVLALLLVSVVLLSALPIKTSAIPFKIEGYLKNTDGMPITLANISISGRYYNSSAQGFQTANFYVDTDSNGYFKLYVAAAEPGGYETGTEMTVAYRTGDGVLSKVVTIQGTGVWANLTYEKKPSVVDALTSTVGLVIVVVLATVTMVGYYLYRSSSEKSNAPKQEEKSPKRVERRRRQR
jgi:hypothetical protein